MKKLLFLLFFLPTLSIACDDHPTTNSKSPLWLKYIVEAASTKKHNHDHKGHSHKVKSKIKKEIPKKAK